MLKFGSKKVPNVMENISIDSNFDAELLERFTHFLGERSEKFSEWMDTVVSFHDISMNRGFNEYDHLNSDGFIVKSLSEDTFRVVTTDGNMYNATVISEDDDGFISTVKVVNYSTPSVEVVFTEGYEEPTLFIHGDNFIISWRNGRVSVEPTKSDGRITAKFILDAPMGLEQLYDKLASDKMQNHLSARTLLEVFTLSQFLDGFTLKSGEELDYEGDHIDFSSDESENDDTASSSDAEGVDVTPEDVKKEDETPIKETCKSDTAVGQEFETREFSPTFKNPDVENDDFHDRF